MLGVEILFPYRPSLQGVAALPPNYRTERMILSFDIFSVTDR